MTEKELKKLNRYQLLELIILQTQEIDSLKKQLADTEQKLESQQIRVSQAGSIAEAALQLNDIFQVAQSTADLYVQRVRQQDEKAEQIEHTARQAADTMLLNAQQESERMLTDARQQAAMILENARKHSADILQLARSQSADILQEAAASTQKYHPDDSPARKSRWFGK